MKRKALLLLGLFVLLMVVLPMLACGGSSLLVRDEDLGAYVDGTPVAAECCWPFN